MTEHKLGINDFLHFPLQDFSFIYNSRTSTHGGERGIRYLWLRVGKIKMKRDDNSNTIQVNHLSVPQQNFPNFDFN